MKSDDMRQEFRRLTRKYGERARRLKMCQWVPELLGELRDVTNAAPSPHPLRVAVCLFVVERLLDNSSLPGGIRTELFAAIYHNGECLDDLQATGISSSILDVMLHAESTQYYQVKQRMDLKNNTAKLEAYETQLETAQEEARICRSLAIGTHFRAWKDRAKKTYAQGAVQQGVRLRNARTMTRVMTTWRQLIQCRRHGRMEEEVAKREKALKDMHEDELRDMKVRFEETIQAKDAAIKSLEDVAAKLRETIHVHETTARVSPTPDGLDPMKRCSELEAKLKHMSRELKESTLKLFDAKQREAEHRDASTAAYNLAMQQLDQLDTKKKKGVTTRALARAALSPDHDVSEPIDDAHMNWDTWEWSASQMRIVGHDKVLLTWANHVLRDTVPQGRELHAGSMADGELLIRVTCYVFKEMSRVTGGRAPTSKLSSLLEEKSLPERVSKYVDAVRLWCVQQHGHAMVDWLTPDRILQMDPYTTNLLLFFLYESYCATHICHPIELAALQSLETNGLGPPSQLQLATARRVAVQYKTGLQIQNELHDYLRSQLFASNVSLGPWSVRRLSADYSPADPNSDVTFKKAMLESHEEALKFFNSRLKDVFLYYSNMSIAYEGMLLGDWHRLVSDLIGKSQAAKEEARVEGIYQSIVHTGKGRAAAGERRRSIPASAKAAGGGKGASFEEFEAMLVHCGETGLVNPAPAQGGRRRTLTANQEPPRVRVVGFLKDVAEKSMRLEVRYHRANYADVYTQMAVQAQSKGVGLLYEFFAVRDPTNRGNNTTLNMDEWLKMCKELELIDSHTSRNDAILYYNIVQEPDEHAAELSASEFQEAMFLVGISRVSNPLISPSHRFTLFCVDRLYPLVRRKFPQIKV
eukprot:TRINITY_DN17502_c0_g1_i2.p1 TRINITY_DN17502_c0_g1~~TRINITY_DN17502_c0_g1_i2.p1  ORF type:complete len:868 (+),score=337.36 TRINITY_DN17502_c0_g1_i2:636-3239(+)